MWSSLSCSESRRGRWRWRPHSDPRCCSLGGIWCLILKTWGTVAWLAEQIWPQNGLVPICSTHTYTYFPSSWRTKICLLPDKISALVLVIFPIRLQLWSFCVFLLVFKANHMYFDMWTFCTESHDILYPHLDNISCPGMRCGVEGG